MTQNNNNQKPTTPPITPSAPPMVDSVKAVSAVKHLSKSAIAAIIAAASATAVAIVGVIGLGITEIGMLLANVLPTFNFLGFAQFLGHEWKWWFTKVAMTCIVLAWNYLGRKILIFK
jgi:hypothetical protein